MFDELKKLLNNSYSPYSKFSVSAIVITDEGKKFSGVNVENASYGATICAERVAITQAISQGFRKFKELHVLVNSDKISTCCFLCRQVIIEFFDEDAKIFLYNKLGEKKQYTVLELCPLPFSEDDLK